MADVYGGSQEIPGAAVWVLTLAIAVPGEELFWRGLVLPELQDATSVVLGAVLAWLGYVAANAILRNLSMLAARSSAVRSGRSSHPSSDVWCSPWRAISSGRPDARVAAAGGACEGDGMSFLSTAVQTVLEQGPFCAVATSAPTGPHCTPLVFAYSGGRLWFTTSRRSVKTRAWKADPSAAGLVRHGELAVTFTGTAKLYDALDRSTWGDAVAGATSIARATAAFSRKNARFFAGYAIDAKQVPFAWAPPGRVFVGIELARTALVDADGVQEGKGRWAGASTSHETFRRSTKGDDPLAALPREVRQPLGAEGDGALTLDRGPRPGRGARALAGRRARALRRPPGRDPRARGGGTRRARGAHRRRGLRVARPRHGGRDAAGHGVDLRPRRPRERGEDRARRSRRRSTPMPGRWCGSRRRAMVWWRGWSSGSADVG